MADQVRIGVRRRWGRVAISQRGFKRASQHMEESTNRFERYLEGGDLAYLRLEGLNLEYIPYVVSVQLLVNKGQKTESKAVELLLAQDYHQRWSLRFWDALMGI